VADTRGPWAVALSGTLATTISEKLLTF